MEPLQKEKDEKVMDEIVLELNEVFGDHIDEEKLKTKIEELQKGLVKKEGHIKHQVIFLQYVQRIYSKNIFMSVFVCQPFLL